METLRNYLNTMFQNLPDTAEVQRARDELWQMMEDKYTDLISEGVSENEAYECPHGELRHELQYGCAIVWRAALAQKVYQGDGEHVSHRVVTSALQLQHRPEVVPQVEALPAQNGEDRRGVGR